MLPQVGEEFIYHGDCCRSQIVSTLIVLPQIIVALMASWVGPAKNWGQQPLLLIGLGELSGQGIRRSGSWSIASLSLGSIYPVVAVGASKPTRRPYTGVCGHDRR
jgi:hypothetical protein